MRIARAALVGLALTLAVPATALADDTRLRVDNVQCVDGVVSFDFRAENTDDNDSDRFEFKVKVAQAKREDGTYRNRFTHFVFRDRRFEEGEVVTGSDSFNRLLSSTRFLKLNFVLKDTSDDDDKDKDRREVACVTT